MSHVVTRRALCAGLATVLLAAAAVGAATLRYTFTAGSELKYRNIIVAEGTLTVAGPLGAQPIPVKVNADETRSLKCLEAAGEGWYWLESKQVKGTYAATVGGEALGAGAESMPPLNYKMKMNAKGDVTELETIKIGRASCRERV